jgi:hypothetical protein
MEYTSQAEQLPPVQSGPAIEHLISLDMYMAIEDLIEDYPYAVEYVDRWFDDIFVLVDNSVVGTFNLLRLPHAYHESFTQFLNALKERDEQNLCIEYLGSAEEGRPVLRVHGGESSTYMW